MKLSGCPVCLSGLSGFDVCPVGCPGRRRKINDLRARFVRFVRFVRSLVPSLAGARGSYYLYSLRRGGKPPYYESERDIKTRNLECAR